MTVSPAGTEPDTVLFYKPPQTSEQKVNGIIEEKQKLQKRIINNFAKYSRAENTKAQNLNKNAYRRIDMAAPAKDGLKYLPKNVQTNLTEDMKADIASGMTMKDFLDKYKEEIDKLKSIGV